jgi:hypothetical protein
MYCTYTADSYTADTKIEGKWCHIELKLMKDPNNNFLWFLCIVHSMTYTYTVVFRPCPKAMIYLYIIMYGHWAGVLSG